MNENLGKCNKKGCNGNYISYQFAGIDSNMQNLYDVKCNKCGKLNCMPSPLSVKLLKLYKDERNTTK